jgi:hypothetical protein
VPPGLSAESTIELIHAQGGLAVAAHPFHPVRGVARGHRTLGAMVPDLALDALEVVNNAVATLAAGQDVRLLCGMPSWVLILFDRIARARALILPPRSRGAATIGWWNSRSRRAARWTCSPESSTRP